MSKLKLTSILFITVCLVGLVSLSIVQAKEEAPTVQELLKDMGVLPRNWENSFLIQFRPQTTEPILAKENLPEEAEEKELTAEAAVCSGDCLIADELICGDGYCQESEYCPDDCENSFSETAYSQSFKIGAASAMQNIGLFLRRLFSL